MNVPTPSYSGTEAALREQLADRHARLIAALDKLREIRDLVAEYLPETEDATRLRDLVWEAVTTPSGPCRCDGRYEGCEHGPTCDQPGGGPWSPYFCAACDPRRMASIGADLRALKAALGGAA